MIDINIGIDIDGVINDLSLFHIACGTKFCHEHDIYNPICATEMDSMDIFKWNRQVDTEFWQEYYSELISSKNFIRPYVATAIENLHKDKHKIYIISARQDTDLPDCVRHSMYQLTEEYLCSNHIYYDDLILTSHKCKVISELNIDVMIEDNPSFFTDTDIFSCILLCFDTSYNKFINRENIVRVYSWFDILNKIKKIAKENVNEY